MPGFDPACAPFPQWSAHINVRTVLLGIVVLVLGGTAVVGCSASGDDAKLNVQDKSTIDAGLKGQPAVDPSQSATPPKAMKKGGPPPPGAPGMGK